MTGGGGDDLLHGDAGTDTAFFSGAIGDYSFAQDNGIVTVTDLRPGGDGVDRLDGFEFLAFSNGTVSIAGLFTPPIRERDATLAAPTRFAHRGAKEKIQ